MIVRVPYGNDAPGDINAQGGVEGDPYGPEPAPDGGLGFTTGPVPGPPPASDPPAGHVWKPKQVFRNGIPIGWTWGVDEAPKGTGRAGRDPAAVALDQAQIDRIRQQIAMEPEKLALEAELGRGRLGMSREELALTREFGMIDRELKRLEFEWKQATDARDFARKALVEDRINAINERKAVVEERLASVQEANQRTNNLEANLKRNEQLGYVVDAEGTGVAAGTPTAKAVQQRFENVRSVGQAVQAASERQLDRRREDARYTSQREDNAIQRDLQQMQLAEQARQFEVGNQQAVASRARPRVFTPGLVVSRAGAY